MYKMDRGRESQKIVLKDRPARFEIKLKRPD